MIRLDITNFRNLRSVQLHDDTALSLITGYNESGKSSIIGALQYAFTGAAFGHRGKEVSRLVTHGEERMHVRATVGGLTVNRTQSSGDSLIGIANQLSVPGEVLPLLFDSEMCGDGGNKAFRAFLDGVASVKFDPKIHFENDPVMKHCIDMAIRSGKVATKQMIKYFEDMRALQKEPPLPVMPTIHRPSQIEIAAAEEAVSAATAALVAATNTVAEYSATNTQLLQIAQYLVELKAYQTVKALAGANDPLPNRAALQKVTGINVQSLKAIKTILRDANIESPDLLDAFDVCVSNIEATIATVYQKLASNPPPPGQPKLPVMPAPAQTLYDGLAAEGEVTESVVKELCLAANGETKAALAVKDAQAQQVASLTAHRNKLLADAGAWTAYDNAVPAYETGKAKANADWKMWDDAAKALSKAETEHVNKAGDAFGTMVSEFSEFVLQGRKITINRDTGITLAGDSIQDCTKSTQWRIEVCIMAAIARTLQSPLLIIDAADILDELNKQKMQAFLLERIVPFFQHVILTSTCRGKLEDEKPPMDTRVTKWVLKNGEIRRLSLAASAA